MKSQRQDSVRIGEEAARWLLRLREDSGTECRADFVTWLKHSPLHLEELLLADAAYGRLDGLDAARRIDVTKLLEQAGAEIVPLQDGNLPLASTSGHSTSGKRIFRWAPAAAGLLLLAGGIFLLQRPAPDDRTYSTTVGEQRSLQLPDGSVVHLNTDSRVEVSFTVQARDLRLAAGEALFVVAADPARPFRVDTGAAVVQAVGTEFNIYRSEDLTTVAVIEGRVNISRHAEQTATPLGAGEEARITPDRMVKRATPGTARTLAWRERQLVFSSDPLSKVVEQVNRYNRTQLRIADPEIAVRRLSGVFNVDDPQSLLTFLGRDGDLTFDYQQDGRLVTIRAAARE